MGSCLSMRKTYLILLTAVIACSVDALDTNEIDGAAVDLRAPAVNDRVVLKTPYGSIVLNLLPDNAPLAVKAVKALASTSGSCDGCKFYRAEARPLQSKGEKEEGPPYALLQGQLDLPTPVPLEGKKEVKAGDVAFIPGAKDFFIALGDHPEWGTSHTVFAQVEDFVSTDLIAVQPYKEIVHEKYGKSPFLSVVFLNIPCPPCAYLVVNGLIGNVGTKMRMIVDPVSFKVVEYQD